MTFNAVKIGSGGFVTGLLSKDKLYARTDNGGAYELNGTTWSLISAGNIESIGKASDGTLYIAEGANRVSNNVTVNGNLYKITNGQKQSVLQVPMGANEFYRWGGERIQVDPVNDSVVYFCSRQSGLQLTLDAGSTWTQVQGIPVGTSDSNGVAGVTFIHCCGCPVTVDGQERSSTLYVGVANDGIYKSTNGGQAWNKILSQTTVPQTAIMVNNLLYVSFFKRSGTASIAAFDTVSSTWSTVYTSGDISAMAALPDGRLLAMRYPMNPSELLIISGLNVSKVTNPSVTTKPGWWPNWAFWTLSGAMRVFGDKVYLSTGIGVISTPVSGNFTQWTAITDGLEQMVSFDAVVTSAGKLVTAMADFNGFYHSDDSTNPTQSHVPQEFSTNTSIAVCESNQSFLVTVSANHHESWRMYSGYSTNGGQTWTKFGSLTANPPTHPSELNFGNIAVACQDTNSIVWLPTNWKHPYYSTNGGQSWTKCVSPFDTKGGGAHTHMWNTQQALCADKVTDKTFYIYHHEGSNQGFGRIFKTTDGGATWTTYEGSAPSGIWKGAAIKSVPGQAGGLWGSFLSKGIHKSSNGGQTFTKLSAIQYSQALAFGAGTSTPRAYMVGKANNDSAIGLYSSSDDGQTWTLYSALPTHLLKVTCLAASPTIQGKVYIGTDGNSFYTANVP